MNIITILLIILFILYFIEINQGRDLFYKPPPKTDIELELSIHQLAKEILNKPEIDQRKIPRLKTANRVNINNDLIIKPNLNLSVPIEQELKNYETKKGERRFKLKKILLTQNNLQKINNIIANAEEILKNKGIILGEEIKILNKIPDNIGVKINNNNVNITKNINNNKILDYNFFEDDNYQRVDDNKNKNGSPTFTYTPQRIN